MNERLNRLINQYSGIAGKGVFKKNLLIMHHGFGEMSKIEDQNKILKLKKFNPKILHNDRLTISAHEAWEKQSAKKENNYTSLEYIIASGDPMVRALAKDLSPNQQKSMWRRYAQVVLRNRNYGRKNKVAGDYIKTKERE